MEELSAALQPLSESGWIHFSENTISVAPCTRAAFFIAESLPHIGCALPSTPPRPLTKWVQEQDVLLSDEQQAAMRLFGATPIAILTGDPGTGKTATIKALAEFFQQAGMTCI